MELDVRGGYSLDWKYRGLSAATQSRLSVRDMEVCMIATENLSVLQRSHSRACLWSEDMGDAADLSGKSSNYTVVLHR